MSDDLVKSLRDFAKELTRYAPPMLCQAADRIEELTRQIEHRDWFLLEKNLWGEFAESMSDFVESLDGEQK